MKRSVANTYQTNRAFENHLFVKKKRSKWKWGIIFFGIFCFLFGIGKILTLPFFSIKHIEIVGLETISQEETVSYMWNRLRDDSFFGITRLNILRHSEENINTLLSTYPFEKIQIHRKGRALTIEVVEHVQGGLVHIANTWALYDLKGKQIRSLTDEEQLYIARLINDEPIDQFLFNKQTPIIEFSNQQQNPESITVIISSIQHMQEVFLQEGYKPFMHIVMEQDQAWGMARMREGYFVLYDFTRPAIDQIQQLKTVEPELRTQNIIDKTVDIRFDGRVYIK